MKLVFAGLLAASLLSIAVSQLPLSGPCSLIDLTSYTAALPNGQDCSAAAARALVPALPGFPPDPSSQVDVFNSFCTPDCAEAVVKYATSDCGNPGLGYGLFFYCLPADTDINRCRFALPDALGTIIDSLTGCRDFNSSNPTCDESCSNSLQQFIDRVGCCYQSLYTNPEILQGFVEGGFFANTVADILTTINDPLLWTTCNLTRPSPCSGDPFPGTTTLSVGTCTESQIGELASNLPLTCASNLAAIFSDPSSTSQQLEDAYDTVCTQDCAGALSELERENCRSEYESGLIVDFCRRTESTLGDRCALILGLPDNATIFYNAGARCFSFDPAVGDCPTGCQAALEDLSENLGCCYQSFYNDTRFLDYLFVNDDVNFDERVFFSVLGFEAAWRACNVPLIAECDPNPFLFPNDAVNLFPSIAVLLFTALLPMLF